MPYLDAYPIREVDILLISQYVKTPSFRGSLLAHPFFLALPSNCTHGLSWMQETRQAETQDCEKLDIPQLYSVAQSIRCSQPLHLASSCHVSLHSDEIDAILRSICSKAKSVANHALAPVFT